MASVPTYHHPQIFKGEKKKLMLYVNPRIYFKSNWNLNSLIK